jgi:hypothetical protein
MYPYKPQKHKQKSGKGNGNKNRSRSIIAYNKPIINSKVNSSTINQMKRELLGRPQEDQVLNTKKASRNTKIKSIDNSIYNKKMNQNSILYNNNYKKISNKKIPQQYNNYVNNIITEKEPKNNIKKRYLYIATNNTKNAPQIQSLTSNSNYSVFSFSNNINEQSSINDKFEESKDNYYDYYENYKVCNPKRLTTYVQIDDLTPIPDRIGSKQHYLAEHDYDEAKRAAVTCRRIEYSYNLRNIIKSEISLDEIITIQRWWRDILRKRELELLRVLKMQEKMQIKLNDLHKYNLFIGKIYYIYARHLLNRFFNRLKKKYGKLYYKNVFNRKAAKIQNAYRTFISQRKVKNQLRLRALLKKYKFQLMKKNILNYLNSFTNMMKKIIRLQNFIKYYLLKKKEAYYLKMANDINPMMYYYLKYGIGTNDKNLFLIKQKKNGFLNMIQIWKKFTKSKKLLKCWMFMENVKFIVKKKFFVYFILRIVERINSMITYFLLKPLMKDILYIYYRKRVGEKVIIWKTLVKKKRRRDTLAINLICKIINGFAFKPFIKQVRKQIMIKDENE